MFQKALLNLVFVVSFLIVFYVVQTSKDQDNVFKTKISKESTENNFEATMKNSVKLKMDNSKVKTVSVVDKYFNVWCIFTKVNSTNSAFRFKFNSMIKSILSHSTVKLSFHIIIDSKSQNFAQNIFGEINNSTLYSVYFKVYYYNIKNITGQLSELTATMMPHFSPRPGAYYGDALFFISLGLHKVAPKTQSRAILLDLDMKFVDDIAQLFQEFNKFGEQAVVGIGPELSPVYLHILHQYRSRHKHSRFGSPQSVGGFQGVNSGVVLLHLDRLRTSQEYSYLQTPAAVTELVNKYNFKGHLGDQDWYTLVGMNSPHLLHLLPCGWNRQLCRWWEAHGYRNVMDSYASCREPTRIYHGNCNTPIPRN